MFIYGQFSEKLQQLYSLHITYRPQDGKKRFLETLNLYHRLLQRAEKYNLVDEPSRDHAMFVQKYFNYQKLKLNDRACIFLFRNYSNFRHLIIRKS